MRPEGRRASMLSGEGGEKGKERVGYLQTVCTAVS